MIHCENDLLLNLISLTPKNARHEFRQRIFKDWHWECAYCSKPLDENTATIDHIVPKFKGGHNVRANMCCCCSSCNKEKGTILLEDWYIKENSKFCKKRFDRLKSWMEQSSYSLPLLPDDVSIGWIST